MVKDILNDVTDQSHAETFGGPALWGRGVPREDSFNKHGQPTLRALLSICVVWDLETKHIDIKCAFLNGVLHQDVCIVQPPMFHDGTRLMWKLKKALYGLKQAARERHKALLQPLSELGFDRCHSNPTLFVSRVGKCFIFLWVDDLLIVIEKKLLQPLVDKILATFDGRDLKELSHVLGMEVKRNRMARTLSRTSK